MAGRPGRDRKLVEDCESIDINEIKKYGFSIFPAIAFIETEKNKDFLLIQATFNPIFGYIKINEKIPLTKTNPYFGGERYWIICPDCGTRVRKLYQPRGEIHFRCRNCYDLMYQSQESNVYDSWLRKQAKTHGMTPKQYEMAAGFQ